MANGGVVPSREIKGGMTIGEKIGKYISSAFSIALESSASRVLQNLNQEFNLKGGPPGSLAGGSFDEDGPPGDFSGEVKAMKAFNYFKSQGYSDFQAAAIVGNLLQENRSMNPRLENSIGMRGIAQWDGNRWSNLEKFAANKKIDPYSFETQLQFIQHELRTGDGGLSASVFKNTKNLEEATVMFRKKYERPGEAEANDAARIKYARGVLQSTKFEYVAPGKVSPVVTGRFGEMRDTGRHGGSDLAVPAGTPLRAISGGKIVESEYESGWGNYTVFIDKNGIYHLYGHMSGRGRGKGSIKKGDIIGYVGMTGRTSGPHLHWEAGTGWNGTITGSFDPLKRYSVNAPFSTQKESSKKVDKNKPSELFNWNQSSLAPSQQSREIASLQQSPSYALIENNTVFYQKEFVLT
jgi:murein DD-endopeptidase MepM/ murein hydrolase activator NlpD